MLYDILDMTSTYIQYLCLLFIIVPNALSSLRHNIRSAIEYFEMTFYRRLDENQRYDRAILGFELPLWLPLNRNLEFALLCIVAPLGLSLVSILALEHKLVFAWYIAMLVSLFCFTFGTLLWADVKDFNVWDGQHIKYIARNDSEAERKGIAFVDDNAIDPAISVRVWMACTGAFGCLVLVVMWVFPIRRAHRRKEAAIRNKMHQFECEEEEKKKLKATKGNGSSKKKHLNPISASKGKDAATARGGTGVGEEAWMTTKALAEYRLQEWQSQKILERTDRTDIIIQMFFSSALFIFGLIAVNVIPLSCRGGRGCQFQASMASQFVGGISISFACLSALWGLLGSFRAGRTLRLVLAEYAAMILLKIIMLAAFLLYTIVTTNLVSMLGCRDLVCTSGMRLPNARTHFPYLSNSTANYRSKDIVAKSMPPRSSDAKLSDCIVCNAFDFEQHSSPLWVQQVCNTTTRESRVLTDARVRCSSKRHLSLSSEVCISILYLLFLPLFQYFISRFAIQLVIQHFPIEQRFIDILSPKEVIMEKLNTCDNEAMFLYRAYKPEFFYFKIIFLFQRVLLALISTVCSYDVHASYRWVGIFLFLTICLTMAGILITLRPFSFPAEAIYFPTTQIMVAVASGILLLANMEGEMSEGVSNIVISILIGVPALALTIGAVLGLRVERRRHERLLERLRRRFIVAQCFTRRPNSEAGGPGPSSTDAPAGRARGPDPAPRKLPVAIPAPTQPPPHEVTFARSHITAPAPYRGDSTDVSPTDLPFRLVSPGNEKRRMSRSDEVNALSNSESLISLSKIITPDMVAPCPEYNLGPRLFTPSLYFVQPLRSFYKEEQRGLTVDRSRELSIDLGGMLDSTAKRERSNSSESVPMGPNTEGRRDSEKRGSILSINTLLGIADHDEGARIGSTGQRILNSVRRLKATLTRFLRALFSKKDDSNLNNQSSLDDSFRNLSHTRRRDTRNILIHVGRLITYRPSSVFQQTYFTYLKFQRILHESSSLFGDFKLNHVYKRYRQLHAHFLRSLDRIVLTHTEIMELRRLNDLNTRGACQKGTAAEDPVLSTISRLFQAHPKNLTMARPHTGYLSDSMGTVTHFPGNISVHDLYTSSKERSTFNSNNITKTTSDVVSCNRSKRRKALSPFNNFCSFPDAATFSPPKSANIVIPSNGDLVAHRMLLSIHAILERQEQGKASSPSRESQAPLGKSPLNSPLAKRSIGGVMRLSSRPAACARLTNTPQKVLKTAPVLLPVPVSPGLRGRGDASGPKWLLQAEKRVREIRAHAERNPTARLDDGDCGRGAAVQDRRDTDSSFGSSACSKEAPTPADLSSLTSSCEEASEVFQDLLRAHAADLLADLKQEQRSTDHGRGVARAMRSTPHLFFQLQPHDSEPGAGWAGASQAEFGDPANLHKGLRAIPGVREGPAAAACVMHLRCRYIHRHATRAAFFKSTEQLLRVQRTIDHKTDAEVGYLFSRLFMILGICATIAIALTISGMLYELDRSYVDGTRLGGDGLGYALAGYPSWEAFTRGCVCTATSNATPAFPFYITDVEEWVCAGGKTKERVRRSATADGGGAFFDGFRVRALCGMTFLAGCRLEVVPGAPGVEPAVRLVGCPPDFSADELRRW